MKLKQLLVASAIASLSLSTAAFAFDHPVQVTDIAEGKSYTLRQHGESVAYFKDGFTGDVTFTCSLSGDHVNAFMYPSKNFLGNLPRILEAGNNGPYTWSLHDLGHDFGKIKIKLLRGKEAILRCVQTDVQKTK